MLSKTEVMGQLADATSALRDAEGIHANLIIEASKVCSLREVAALAGLSHEQVRRVIARGTQPQTMQERAREAVNAL